MAHLSPTNISELLTFQSLNAQVRLACCDGKTRQRLDGETATGGSNNWVTRGLNIKDPQNGPGRSRP